MVDPKYANLPGIAYDQPDCYETNDLPESDQNNDYYEEDNDSIERFHLNANEAFSKFKGKALNAGQVDFSDRMSKHLRTGYVACSGDWELVAEGEKELPLQKFQRLKCEMDELMKEVSRLKTASKDDQTKEQVQSTLIASQLEQTQKQLVDLRLEETLGAEILGNLSDPRGAQLKKLLSQLESYKPPSEGSPEKPSAKEGKGKKGSGESGVITYQLKYRPEQARLAETTRVADLEHKIHRLEAVLGATSDKMSRLCADTRHGSLLAVARHLNTKASLLDPAQLDHVEGRLSALAQKMDSIGQRAAATMEDADKTRKMNELYEIAKKTEAMSYILPQTLERMFALEALHQQAADFSKSLTQLEALQPQITANLKNNEELMKGVEKSFKQNLDTVKKDMSGLDARIAALKKK